MICSLAIIALLIYPVVNFLEAWLEEIVILMKNAEDEKYHHYNEQEHKRSFVFAAAVMVPFIAIVLMMQWYFLLPAIFVNRRLVFDFGLKKFRQREMWIYEGNGPVDAFFKKIFGVNGAKKEFILWIAVTLISIILQIVW